MKLDARLIPTNSLGEVPSAAAAAERIGFAGLWSVEGSGDAFMPLTLAAASTKSARLGTAVALAFPRSPMVTAYIAWELARLSSGRFVLGLGSQVKDHMERRFSVPWDKPVARMRDYIGALRAIFRSWEAGGSDLAYASEHYSFSMMNPFFAPSHNPFGHIPIYLAAVNKSMCQLAGECCDGLIVHPLHSVTYLSDFIVPNVQIGLNKAKRSRQDFCIFANAFVTVGESSQAIEAARFGIKQQVAMFAATPEFKGILEIHGWGDVASELQKKAADRAWGEMFSAVSNEMLDEFSLAGSFCEIGHQVKERYAGLLDRVGFYTPYFPGIDDISWQRLVEEFNSTS